MSVEVALIVSIVSVAFSVYFGLKNNKRTDTKDIEERVKSDTVINMKLDEIGRNVQTLTKEMTSLREDINSHNERLIKVEESTKSAHHRLNMIEEKLKLKVESED